MALSVAGTLLSTGLLFVVAYTSQDRIAALATTAAAASCVWNCFALLRLAPLSPAAMYLYMLLLFHMGLVGPWALGINQIEPPRWLLGNDIAPGLSMLILALGGFALGVALGRPDRTRRTTQAEGPQYYNDVLFLVGVGTALLGLALFTYGILNVGAARFLAASYIESIRLTAWYDAGYFHNGMTVIPIGVYMAAASARKRWLPLLLVGTGAWAAVVSVLGFRGIALVPCITLVAILIKRGVRIPKWVLVSGALVVLCAISAIRLSRNSALGQRELLPALAAASPLAAVEEMGNSLRPLVHTIHFLETEPYRYGYTYWQALEGALPSILGSRGRGYVAVEDMPPSMWVSRLAAPWNFAHFGGIGFSAVAEPYMNFGPAGVAIYFLLLAYGLVCADRFDDLRPTRLALWAIFLGPLLWTSRNAFTVLFRPVMFGCAAVFAARVLGDSIARSRQQSALHARPLPAGPPSEARWPPPASAISPAQELR